MHRSTRSRSLNSTSFFMSPFIHTCAICSSPWPTTMHAMRTSAAAPSVPAAAYCDEKVANRDTKIWHFEEND
jgi:hypothetical protein